MLDEDTLASALGRTATPPSSLRCGGQWTPWPALSPQQRGAHSVRVMVESQASFPGWRGLSGAAGFSWDPAWVLLLLVPAVLLRWPRQ